MAEIRINGLANTAQTASNDDYVVLDGATNGTRKMLASKLTEGIEQQLATTNQNVAQNAEEITDLKEDLKLLADEIPNTVQTYTFSGGSVSKVEHKANNVVVRTDTFTYGTNTITEVRRLSTGESLTIVTNLTTLETTVTYAAA